MKNLDKFPEFFNGIGCLEDYEQSLHVNPTVFPVAQRPRRIPFHLRKQVSAKLEELAEGTSRGTYVMGITHSSCLQTTQFRRNQIMRRLPSSKSGIIAGETSNPNCR